MLATGGPPNFGGVALFLVVAYDRRLLIGKHARDARQVAGAAQRDAEEAADGILMVVVL
jgi:hypothetical protein